MTVNEWVAVLLVACGLGGAVRLTVWTYHKRKKIRIKKVEKILSDIKWKD